MQVPNFYHLKHPKILIVDDIPEMRTAVKKMVEGLGIHETPMMCSNGEEATKLLKESHFDMVLCDYNLGDGKDGQQVLEEARFAKSLSYQTVFCMLTAESTADMVMGALEHEPDAYIIKPFPKEALAKRLSAALEMKSDLKTVYAALDNEAYEQVISEANALLKTDPNHKVQVECKKRIAQAQLALKKYEEAKSVYSDLVANYDPPFAHLGLAKANFFMGKTDAAIMMLQDLVAQHSQCIEPYDWLAQAFVQKEAYEAAQDTIKAAIRLSPKAILRQQALGKIALETGDEAGRIRAFRQSVRLGRHSCHRRVDDYCDLAAALLTKASRTQSIQGKLAGKEVLTLMDELSSWRKNDAEVTLLCTLMKTAAYGVLDKMDEVKHTFDYLKSARAEQALSIRHQIEYIRMAVLTKADSEASDWAFEFEKNFSQVESAIQSYNQMLKDVNNPIFPETGLREQFKVLEQHFVQSQKLLKANDFQGAIDLLKTLEDNLSWWISYQLTWVQLCLSALRVSPDKISYAEMAESMLRKLHALPESDPRTGTVSKLNQVYQGLTKENAP